MLPVGGVKGPIQLLGMGLCPISRSHADMREPVLFDNHLHLSAEYGDLALELYTLGVAARVPIAVARGMFPCRALRQPASMKHQCYS